LQGEETIAAVATGSGEAGIGVIRISGAEAVMVAHRSFRPRQGVELFRRASHRVVYGWVIDSRGQVVDEALAIVMKGPRSFTGEDVVEFHCHGGQVALRQVLGAALAAGARLAEPGEFTRRAFMNGRIDLAQAEAVVDIIRAKTDRAMAAAVDHLRGELSESIAAIRERLLVTAAHLEADIDFPELDLEVQTFDEVVEGCTWSLGRVRALLGSARQGKLLREGFRVVLAGRPNVGKSSLLNRLVRENRAIVTEVPGTTRDVIEEWVNFGGLPVILADTAGIRETDDLVEQMGVDRSRAALERADLIALVVDGEAGVTGDDRAVLDRAPLGRPLLLLVNKVDLVPVSATEQIAIELGIKDSIGVSARTGEGIQLLEERIAQVAGVADTEEAFVANARQEEALRRGERHLEAALETRRLGFGSDLLSIDVRAAWMALGEITGESVGEDLLDQIFNRFCIGK
jgi:tRNA modification GTPase